MAMTDELKKRLTKALIALNILVRKHENNPPLFRDLCEIQTAFLDLYEDWAKRCDPLLALTPAIKAQWLRELADQIEEDEQ